MKKKNEEIAVESSSDTLQSTRFNAREVVSTQSLQHTSVATDRVWYSMVGNFCKELIFGFFINWKPFTKIKTVKFLMPTMHGKRIVFQSGTTSNYLAILTPIEDCSKCAFDRYCSGQLQHNNRWMNWTAVQGQSRSNRLYVDLRPACGLYQHIFSFHSET